MWVGGVCVCVGESNLVKCFAPKALTLYLCFAPGQGFLKTFCPKALLSTDMSCDRTYHGVHHVAYHVSCVINNIRAFLEPVCV